MNVYDFLDYYNDCGDVEVWDFNSEKTVCKGDMHEVMWEYGDYEVESFDITSRGVLIINISIEEE